MGKSSSPARSRSSRRGGRADVIEMFSMPKRGIVAQIIGLVIRARAELLMATVVVVSLTWLHDNTDDVTYWLVVAGVPVVVIALPWSRRFVVARLWCVADRHRLRACLRQTKVRTMNMDGALPFMVWARPTKTGERVWLWIRAGSSGDDIEAALSYIAPACLARDARLHRVRKCTTLVAVDVIRRDPLGGKRSVGSPLARLTTMVTGQVAMEGTEPITGATVQDITAPSSGTTVTALPDAPATPQRKTIRKSDKITEAGPSVVVNGEDLSDYVD